MTDVMHSQIWTPQHVRDVAPLLSIANQEKQLVGLTAWAVVTITRAIWGWNQLSIFSELAQTNLTISGQQAWAVCISVPRQRHCRKPLRRNIQELKMNASKITKKSFASGEFAPVSFEVEKTKPDPVLQHLENLHLPLTRENYLEVAYPMGLPEGWSQEDEASLPHEIRRIII